MGFHLGNRRRTIIKTLTERWLPIGAAVTACLAVAWPLYESGHLILAALVGASVALAMYSLLVVLLGRLVRRLDPWISVADADYVRVAKETLRAREGDKTPITWASVTDEPDRWVVWMLWGSSVPPQEACYSVDRDSMAVEEIEDKCSYQPAFWPQVRDRLAERRGSSPKAS